jgi:hypothetical protein
MKTGTTIILLGGVGLLAYGLYKMNSAQASGSGTLTFPGQAGGSYHLTNPNPSNVAPSVSSPQYQSQYNPITSLHSALYGGMYYGP